MSIKNNRGASLVETLIYIVLGMLVIGYALSSMTHISKGYVKNRTVMKLQKDGRDAIQVMAREIANTGFKYYIEERNSNSRDFFITRPRLTATTIDDGAAGFTVPAEPRWIRTTVTGSWSDGGNFRDGSLPDSAASFFFGDGGTTGDYDSLEIFKATLNNQGNGLEDTHRIMYTVDANGNLVRTYQWNKKADLDNTAQPLWPSANTQTFTIIENVRALQFLFSENGRDWVSNITGKRHLMKQIKIQLLVKSEKEFQEKYAIDYPMGNLTTPISSGGSDGSLYRLYEKVVEIPNNGILLNN